MNLTRDPLTSKSHYRSFAVLAMRMPSPALLLYSVMHNVLYWLIRMCFMFSKR